MALPIYLSNEEFCLINVSLVVLIYIYIYIYIYIWGWSTCVNVFSLGVGRLSFKLTVTWPACLFMRIFLGIIFKRWPLRSVATYCQVCLSRYLSLSNFCFKVGWLCFILNLNGTYACRLFFIHLSFLFCFVLFFVFFGGWWLFFNYWFRVNILSILCWWMLHLN